MKYLVIVLLIIVGFFLVASTETCLGIMRGNEYIVPTVLNNTNEYDLAIAELIGNDFAGLVLFIISLTLFSWLLGVYRKITRVKRTKSVTTRDNVKKPFILYLRSFADEKSTGKRIKKLSDSRSEEEMLIDSFSDIAPVYAIGDPSDKKMPYGATRIYVDDAEWKQTVVDLAQDAEIVILRLGQTNNFWWEVNMALKKVPVEKIVFVIPWSKNFNNVSALYKILLEHNIDISTLNVSVDKKRYGSISSVLFFNGQIPITKEIVIPRFSGVFLSYDNLLRNALSSFREKYGFKTKKRLPILKTRLLSLVLLLMVIVGCVGSFWGHLMELKYQRPYELVEECVKDPNFVSKYGSDVNGTNLNWAIVGSIRGKFLLTDEDFINMLLIEDKALNQVSYSEAAQINSEPFNSLLIIKKYTPEHYQEYVDLTSKATLLWIKHSEDASNALLYYKHNIENLPNWVYTFFDEYSEESDSDFESRWIEEAMKHIGEPDFSDTMKTLMAQSVDA